MCVEELEGRKPHNASVHAPCMLLSSLRDRTTGGLNSDQLLLNNYNRKWPDPIFQSRKFVYIFFLVVR